MRRVALILFLSIGVAFGQAPRPPVDQLSQLTDVQITGPINGQVLTYDSGTLKWKNAAGGGGGTPGGSNKQFQYNNLGAFGGVSGFTFTSPDYVEFRVDENAFVGFSVNNYDLGSSAGSYIGVGNNSHGLTLTQYGNGNAPVGVGGTGDAEITAGTPINISAVNTLRFRIGLGAPELARIDANGFTLDSGSVTFTPTGSAPTGVEGRVYANTDHKLYYYNGTSYIDLTAGGAGGGTPGGSTKDIQWNNAGAFAGGGPQYDSTAITITNAGNVNGNLGNIVQNTSTGTGAQATFVSKNSTTQANYGITGTGLSAFSDLVANQAYLYTDSPVGLGLFANNGTGKVLIAAGGLSRTALFDNDGGLKFGSSSDTGIARNSSGVMEINNGTLGQYRDVKVRTVIHNAYTVATLPTGVAGMVAYITDGTASLAWGATATGGSTTKYLVWYNGTNWTVVGK